MDVVTAPPIWAHSPVSSPVLPFVGVAYIMASLANTWLLTSVPGELISDAIENVPQIDADHGAIPNC